MRRITVLTVAAGAMWIASAATAARAQSLAERLARLPDGHARLAFAARPGVCGDGRGTIQFGSGNCLRFNGTIINGRISGQGIRCEPGPVRVRLEIEGGRVTEIRTVVGHDDAEWGGTDLGTVPAADASQAMARLASQVSGRSGSDAVLAAALADSGAPWPDLLALARDTRVERRVRREAMFWLGRAAAARVEGVPLEVAETEDAAATRDDDDVRAQAVFSLSQLPAEESLPALIHIARTHRDARVRRAAFFWLSESLDPRVTDLYATVLRGGR